MELSMGLRSQHEIRDWSNCKLGSKDFESGLYEKSEGNKDKTKRKTRPRTTMKTSTRTSGKHQWQNTEKTNTGCGGGGYLVLRQEWLALSCLVLSCLVLSCLVLRQEFVLSCPQARICLVLSGVTWPTGLHAACISLVPARQFASHQAALIPRFVKKDVRRDNRRQDKTSHVRRRQDKTRRQMTGDKTQGKTRQAKSNTRASQDKTTHKTRKHKTR